MWLLRQFGYSPRARRKRNYITISQSIPTKYFHYVCHFDEGEITSRFHRAFPQSISTTFVISTKEKSHYGSAKYFRPVCHFDEGEITSRFRKVFLQSISAKFVISTKEKSHHDSAMHCAKFPRPVCHFDEGEITSRFRNAFCTICYCFGSLGKVLVISFVVPESFARTGEANDNIAQKT
jgi:hypothetical protein